MALGPTDPALALKITPPRIPRTVLDRPRLSSVRPEFADKAVVAIHGSAGSGKTSLLAQWRKEALQSGAVVAWLTLDGRDTDDRLVLGLAAAMRSASGRPGFEQLCTRAAEPNEGPLEGITEWLAEVADMSAETMLFLDDVHALPSTTVDSSLAYLVLNAPANLRIVLASRRPIALPIAELPARGRFAAVTANELRFDLVEALSLLQARFGRRIDLDSCVRLHELTEGWPLGLQLAISAVERSPDLREAIAAFSLRSGDINRYFVECLVDQLPRPAAQFLVQVCFVDAVSPGLCEAITRRDDAAQLLAQLHELTPIFSEGVDGEWSRIHPLAHEFLRARFAQLPEAEKREYHARAARWLEEHGQREEAARQMFDAGLVEAAYELVERSLHDVLLKGRVSLVSDWIERLPRDEVLRRTNLRLTVGWILAQSERHGEAAQLVGPILDDATADPGVRCESAEICAAAALFADDLEAMDRIVSAWYDALPTNSTMRYLVGVNELAFLTLYRGAPDQARYSYRQLPGDESAAGRYALGWRDWIVGISYLWEGQVDLAAQKLSTALARAEEESGRRSPIAGILASALAAAQWERNETETAAALLANRLDVLERGAPPDAIMMGFVTAVRVASLARDEQRALDLLDHLYALGESRGLPRLCVASLCERMRLHALRGRADLCGVVERKLDGLDAALASREWGALRPVVELQVALARAYAAVARRDWQGAIERLTALVPAAERLRRGRDAVQIFMLRALAMTRSGKDGSSALDEALSMARMWGMSRVLDDTHPDLVRFAGLPGTDMEREPGAGREPTESLRTRDTPARASTGRGPRAPRGSLLSPREREVLRLLATNLSNKQIALAMGVSDETIKWHFKNLFRKLNAGSRAHLLHRARMVGVVEPVS